MEMAISDGECVQNVHKSLMSIETVNQNVAQICTHITHIMFINVYLCKSNRYKENTQFLFIGNRFYQGVNKYEKKYHKSNQTFWLRCFLYNGFLLVCNLEYS